jgi:hypothetical protein
MRDRPAAPELAVVGVRGEHEHAAPALDHAGCSVIGGILTIRARRSAARRRETREQRRRELGAELRLEPLAGARALLRIAGRRVVEEREVRQEEIRTRHR